MSIPDDQLREESQLLEPAFSAADPTPDQPGMHALIVGVSRYPNLPLPGAELTRHQERYGLGLSQLSCAAKTCKQIYDWLTSHAAHLSVPLVTCRLLLAPSETELTDFGSFSGGRMDARLDSFLRAAKAWRADCASDSRNVAFFYFAGHGFERKRGEQVLILEDVGDGLGGRLSKGVEVSNLVQGMAPSRDYPEIARTQLFFFDACRLPLVDGYRWEEEVCQEVWGVPVVATDERDTMQFFTTKPGLAAYAFRDKHTLFGQAFLECLEGAGAELASSQHWQVSVPSLNRGLAYQLRRMLEHEEVVRQSHMFSGSAEPFVIATLDTAPEVDLRVEVIPSEYAEVLQVAMHNPATGEQELLGPPIAPNPLLRRARAGRYIVTARGPGAEPVLSAEALDPPFGSWLFSSQQSSRTERPDDETTDADK